MTKTFPSPRFPRGTPQTGNQRTRSCRRTSSTRWPGESCSRLERKCNTCFGTLPGLSGDLIKSFNNRGTIPSGFYIKSFLRRSFWHSRPPFLYPFPEIPYIHFYHHTTRVAATPCGTWSPAWGSSGWRGCWCWSTSTTSPSRTSWARRWSAWSGSWSTPWPPTSIFARSTRRPRESDLPLGARSWVRRAMGMAILGAQGLNR